MAYKFSYLDAFGEGLERRLQLLSLRPQQEHETLLRRRQHEPRHPSQQVAHTSAVASTSQDSSRLSEAPTVEERRVRAARQQIRDEYPLDIRAGGGHDDAEEDSLSSISSSEVRSFHLDSDGELSEREAPASVLETKPDIIIEATYAVNIGQEVPPRWHRESVGTANMARQEGEHRSVEIEAEDEWTMLTYLDGQFEANATKKHIPDDIRIDRDAALSSRVDTTAYTSPGESPKKVPGTDLSEVKEENVRRSLGERFQNADVEGASPIRATADQGGTPTPSPSRTGSVRDDSRHSHVAETLRQPGHAGTQDNMRDGEGGDVQQTRAPSDEQVSTAETPHVFSGKISVEQLRQALADVQLRRQQYLVGSASDTVVHPPQSFMRDGVSLRATHTQPPSMSPTLSRMLQHRTDSSGGLCHREGPVSVSTTSSASTVPVPVATREDAHHRLSASLTSGADTPLSASSSSRARPAQTMLPPRPPRTVTTPSLSESKRGISRADSIGNSRRNASRDARLSDDQSEAEDSSDSCTFSCFYARNTQRLDELLARTHEAMADTFGVLRRVMLAQREMERNARDMVSSAVPRDGETRTSLAGRTSAEDLGDDVSTPLYIRRLRERFSTAERVEQAERTLEGAVAELDEREKAVAERATAFVRAANLLALRCINEGRYSAALVTLMKADAVVAKDAGQMFRFLPEPEELREYERLQRRRARYAATGDVLPEMRPAAAGTSHTTSHPPSWAHVRTTINTISGSAGFLEPAEGVEADEGHAPHPATPAVWEMQVLYFTEPHHERERQVAAASLANNFGLYHFSVGEYSAARARLQSTVELEASLGSALVPTMGITLMNLAQAQWELKMRRDALGTLVQAEETVEDQVRVARHKVTRLRRVKQQKEIATEDFSPLSSADEASGSRRLHLCRRHKRETSLATSSQRSGSVSSMDSDSESGQRPRTAGSHASDAEESFHRLVEQYAHRTQYRRGSGGGGGDSATARVEGNVDEMYPGRPSDGTAPRAGPNREEEDEEAAERAGMSAEDKAMVEAWLAWREDVCLLSRIHEQHARWLLLLHSFRKAAVHLDLAIRWQASIVRPSAGETNRMEALKGELRVCRQKIRRHAAQEAVYHRRLPYDDDDGALTRRRHRPSRSSIHQVRQSSRPGSGSGAPSQTSVPAVRSSVVTTVLPRHLEVVDESIPRFGRAPPSLPAPPPPIATEVLSRFNIHDSRKAKAHRRKQTPARQKSPASTAARTGCSERLHVLSRPRTSSAAASLASVYSSLYSHGATPLPRGHSSHGGRPVPQQSLSASSARPAWNDDTSVTPREKVKPREPHPPCQRRSPTRGHQESGSASQEARPNSSASASRLSGTPPLWSTSTTTHPHGESGGAPKRTRPSAPQTGKHPSRTPPKRASSQSTRRVLATRGGTQAVRRKDPIAAMAERRQKLVPWRPDPAAEDAPPTRDGEEGYLSSGSEEPANEKHVEAREQEETTVTVVEGVEGREEFLPLARSSQILTRAGEAVFDPHSVLDSLYDSLHELVPESDANTGEQRASHSAGDDIAVEDDTKSKEEQWVATVQDDASSLPVEERTDLRNASATTAPPPPSARMHEATIPYESSSTQLDDADDNSGSSRSASEEEEEAESEICVDAAPSRDDSLPEEEPSPLLIALADEIELHRESVDDNAIAQETEIHQRGHADHSADSQLLVLEATDLTAQAVSQKTTTAKEDSSLSSDSTDASSDDARCDEEQAPEAQDEEGESLADDEDTVPERENFDSAEASEETPAEAVVQAMTSTELHADGAIDRSPDPITSGSLLPLHVPSSHLMEMGVEDERSPQDDDFDLPPFQSHDNALDDRGGHSGEFHRSVRGHLADSGRGGEGTSAKSLSTTVTTLLASAASTELDVTATAALLNFIEERLLAPRTVAQPPQPPALDVVDATEVSEVTDHSGAGATTVLPVRREFMGYERFLQQEEAREASSNATSRFASPLPPHSSTASPTGRAQSSSDETTSSPIHASAVAAAVSAAFGSVSAEPSVPAHVVPMDSLESHHSSTGEPSRRSATPQLSTMPQPSPHVLSVPTEATEPVDTVTAAVADTPLQAYLTQVARAVRAQQQKAQSTTLESATALAAEDTVGHRLLTSSSPSSLVSPIKDTLLPPPADTETNASRAEDGQHRHTEGEPPQPESPPPLPPSIGHQDVAVGTSPTVREGSGFDSVVTTSAISSTSRRRRGRLFVYVLEEQQHRTDVGSSATGSKGDAEEKERRAVTLSSRVRSESGRDSAVTPRSSVAATAAPASPLGNEGGNRRGSRSVSTAPSSIPLATTSDAPSSDHVGRELGTPDTTPRPRVPELQPSLSRSTPDRGERRGVSGIRGGNVPASADTSYSHPHDSLPAPMLEEPGRHRAKDRKEHVGDHSYETQRTPPLRHKTRGTPTHMAHASQHPIGAPSPFPTSASPSLASQLVNPVSVDHDSGETSRHREPSTVSTSTEVSQAASVLRLLQAVRANNHSAVVAATGHEDIPPGVSFTPSGAQPAEQRFPIGHPSSLHPFLSGPRSASVSHRNARLPHGSSSSSTHPEEGPTQTNPSRPHGGHPPSAVSSTLPPSETGGNGRSARPHPAHTTAPKEGSLTLSGGPTTLFPGGLRAGGSPNGPPAVSSLRMAASTTPTRTATAPVPTDPLGSGSWHPIPLSSQSTTTMQALVPVPSALTPVVAVDGTPSTGSGGSRSNDSTSRSPPLGPGAGLLYPGGSATTAHTIAGNSSRTTNPMAPLNPLVARPGEAAVPAQPTYVAPSPIAGVTTVPTTSMKHLSFETSRETSTVNGQQQEETIGAAPVTATTTAAGWFGGEGETATALAPYRHVRIDDLMAASIRRRLIEEESAQLIQGAWRGWRTAEGSRPGAHPHTQQGQ